MTDADVRYQQLAKDPTNKPTRQQLVNISDLDYGGRPRCRGCGEIYEMEKGCNALLLIYV